MLKPGKDPPTKMATEAQIKANQQNAQHSQGPTSEAGAARSSQNSRKHGFTGRTLVLHPEEAESYETHVASYLEDYRPATHHQNQLVRQLADLDYSLHQISIEQSNTVTHMNVISSLPPDPANPNAVSTLLAPYTRLLNTLNLYETRRRRASKSVGQELEALQKFHSEKRAKDLSKAAKLYKAYKAKGITLVPEEFGFVCSLAEIEAAVASQTPSEPELASFIPTPEAPKTRQPIRVTPQPGRNAPCSCGSGLKFKRCCIDKRAAAA
jgi:SEC-C motif